MSKSLKELAFLRDLTVTKDWTERFTIFADKKLKFPKEGNILYYNVGTLSHTLELREKLDNKKINLTAIVDDKELGKIAEAKAKAIKAVIDFKSLDDLESESFDLVLADLTFVKPNDLSEIIDELVYLTKKGGEVAVFLPTAGSFGEIYSFLWETFLETDLIEKSGEIERLVNQIPTISRVEELAKESGIIKVESATSTEIFEYDNGKDFINSTLLGDFLFPVWLDFLDKKQRKDVINKLADIINKEHDNLTFRFSVKATLIGGVKA